MRLLVQWWLRGPAGRSATFVAGAVICVCALRVRERARRRRCWRRRASSPTSAMPNGELSPVRNAASHLGDAVAVRVAQQRDAVGAGHRAAGLLLVALEEPALDALVVLGPRRRVGLGHEHVAVRQHVEPARMDRARGRTRRRWCRSAATGVAPSGQPVALTTLTVGISDLSGCGSVGLGADAPSPPAAARSRRSPRRRRRRARTQRAG